MLESWAKLYEDIGCFLTKKHYHRLVLLHATKKVWLDVLLWQTLTCTFVGKNLPPVLHTLFKNGYASTLSTNECASAQSKTYLWFRNFTFLTHSTQYQRTGYTDKSKRCRKYTRLKRTLPRGFTIHLSKSILAITLRTCNSKPGIINYFKKRSSYKCQNFSRSGHSDKFMQMWYVLDICNKKHERI